MTQRLFNIFIFIFLILTAKAEITVSVLTIGPGEEVYELEGHTELHLEDSDRGLNIVVSWGVFDFDSPGFIYRFVKGETDYIAAAYPYSHFIARNADSGREVRQQTLDLTQEEAQKVLSAVEHNIRPENRVYCYNYVKDNCATRPLALIERAIDGELSIPGDSSLNSSWRTEMARFHHDYPWYQFGIDLALGSGIDHPITRREKCYAPVNLYGFLEEATRPDGRPIVRESIQLFPESAWPLSSPTPRLLSPLTVSWVVLMITMWICMRSIARRHDNRLFMSIMYFIAAIAGLILTFLIFVSEHEATNPNWLYLWLNPLAIIPLFGVWLKKLNRVVYCYQIVNFVFLTVLLLIGITGVQTLNVALYPLIASYLTISATNIYLYRCQQKTSPSKAA